MDRLINSSAKKIDSANFALTEFSNLRPEGLLRFLYNGASC
jgi:hypothetical protein